MRVFKDIGNYFKEKFKILPWAAVIGPGAEGLNTNFCGLRGFILVTLTPLGRAWTSAAIVTCPAAFLISKLVGWLCNEELDEIFDATDCGGAGAIFVGVLVGPLLTRVTFPPANLAPCFPAKILVVGVPWLVVATETLFTINGCPCFKNKMTISFHFASLYN